MVAAGRPQFESEPTPEFNERCITVIRSWEAGQLPFTDAVEQINHLLQQAMESEHLANQARAQHMMGYIQHYRGNLTSSIRHYEESYRLYQRVENFNRMATIELNQGENYRFKGDFNRALTLYRKAYQAAVDVDNVVIQTMAIANEGLTLISLNQYERALAALEEGRELVRAWTETGDKRDSTLCEIYQGLAKVHLLQNKPEYAWEVAVLALQTAHKTDQPLAYGFANRILGDVVTRLDGAPEEGFSADPDTYYRTALTAFRDLNAEAELARTMFAQAKSLAMRGRRTSAARKLQQVMIIFTRLEMLDDAARAAEAQLAVI